MWFRGETINRYSLLVAYNDQYHRNFTGLLMKLFKMDTNPPPPPPNMELQDGKNLSTIIKF